MKISFYGSIIISISPAILYLTCCCLLEVCLNHHTKNFYILHFHEHYNILFLNFISFIINTHPWHGTYFTVLNLKFKILKVGGQYKRAEEESCLFVSFSFLPFDFPSPPLTQLLITQMS